MKKHLLLIVFLIAGISAFSQMTLITESFDNTYFPPLGWNQGKLGGSDPDNYWEYATNAGGMQPAGVLPFVGPGMARYRADVTTSGEASFLSSPQFDLTNNAGASTVNFRMFRDNSSTAWDSLVVIINTVPSNTGPNALRLGMIPRYYNYAPVAIINTWVPYFYPIPTTAPYTTSSVYIIFVGYSVNGANIYIDDFSIQTYPKQQVFSSAGLSYQEVANVGKNTTTQHIITLKITTDGAGDPLRLDSLTFNPNGTTSLSDIVNAKIFYTKGTNAFVTTAGNNLNGTIIGFPNFTNMLFPGGGFYLENGDNYFWLTYDIPALATSGNFVDADLANGFGLGSGIYLTDTTGIDVSWSPPATPTTLPGARMIDISYCGGAIPTYAVGTSWLNGSYTNNDYIAEVDLIGEPFYPIIDNPWNNNGPFMPVTPTPFAAHPPDYEQFNQPGTVLTPGNKITTAIKHGGNYNITLKVGTWFAANCIQAWIDYNGDGDWLDVVGGRNERLSPGANATCLAGSASTTYNFTVPNAGTGVVTGNTRLRVREVFAVSNINPCNNYTFGEIEDYTITVIPFCNALYKLWLGYTNDWNTPNNWCGGVPSINDIAIVDTALVGGSPSLYNYRRPEIHSGTIATAKTIRIGPADTLWVNAPSSSSLTVADSLNISYRTNANGSMRIISAMADTEQVSNGTTTRTFIMPFRGGIREQRLQMIYTKAELLARGMLPGDIIDGFRFHFSTKAGVATTYQNYTISYYYTNITCFTPPTPTPAPVGAAGGTVFVGNVTIPNPLPGLVYNLALFPNAFIWNPPVGNDHLVVQLCWDNLAAPPVGDQQLCTQTAGCNTTIYFYHNTTQALGACGLTQAAANGSGMYDFRPNITFQYHRPYNKYPVYMGNGPAYGKGDFINNGSFVPGYSRVIFNGDSTANQSIGGVNPTTFYELEIDKPVASTRQDRPVTVTDSIILTNGPYLLNGLTLTLTNPITSAATRTNGYLVSEDPASLGILQWNIGLGPAGNYTFPFGSALGYTQFELIKTAAANNVGNVSVSTYGTGMPNTPYPPTVMHVNNASGTPNDGSETVDRFWMLNKTGAGAADIAFNFTNAEVSTGALSPGVALVAQRWLGSGWQAGIGANTSNTRVYAAGVNATFNGPYALTLVTNPLPVELLSFDAVLVKDKVKIYWSTVSEIDNDYFIVERSKDLHAYDFISQVDSRGPGSSLLEYETYDPQPMKGINYYRLTQVDINGERESFPPVAVNYNPSAFDIVSVYHPAGSSDELEVVFVNGIKEKINLQLTDVSGRIVFAQELISSEGYNVVKINSIIETGVYLITLRSETDIVTRKVFN